MEFASKSSDAQFEEFAEPLVRFLIDLYEPTIFTAPLMDTLPKIVVLSFAFANSIILTARQKIFKTMAPLLLLAYSRYAGYFEQLGDLSTQFVLYLELRGEKFKFRKDIERTNPAPIVSKNSNYSTPYQGKLDVARYSSMNSVKPAEASPIALGTNESIRSSGEAGVTRLVKVIDKEEDPVGIAVTSAPEFQTVKIESSSNETPVNSESTSDTAVAISEKSVLLQDYFVGTDKGNIESTAAQTPNNSSITMECDEVEVLPEIVFDFENLSD